jgi:hypothetical protein
MTKTYFNSVYPVTKAFINDLRACIGRHFSPDLEKYLTDKTILRIADTIMLEANLNAVFRDGDNLDDEAVIEF